MNFDIQSDSDDSLHNLSSEQSEESISRDLVVSPDNNSLLTEFVTLEIKRFRPPSKETEQYSEIHASSHDDSDSGNESDDEYEPEIFELQRKHKLMRWAPIFLGTAICAMLAIQ